MKWNEIMGEAVVMKGARDTAYDRIESARLSIENAKDKGRTVGIEEAEDKLSEAEAAFKEDKYKEAAALATDALKLAGAATKP